VTAPFLPKDVTPPRGWIRKRKLERAYAEGAHQAFVWYPRIPKNCGARNWSEYERWSFDAGYALMASRIDAWREASRG